MKSFAVTWNWSLSPMTFSMSLPNVLRRTMGWKDLEWLYDCLEITTVDEHLKWFDQCPRLIQASAILMMLQRHSSCLRIDLRWLQDNLSGPGIDELLQLLIACLNSSLENGVQKVNDLLLISLRTSMLICQWKVVLKVKWKAFLRLSRVKHD